MVESHVKETDPVHLCHLLRLGSDRRGEKARPHGCEKSAAIHVSVSLD